MADATPVHPKGFDKEEKAPKPTPSPAPVKKKPKIEEVQVHIPASPGNHYKMPDGTVVEDH